MTLAAYHGQEALTFTDYLDLESGKTLHAEPGGTYDIAPASGHVVPDVPEPWFTAVFATGGIVTGSVAFAGEGEVSDPAGEPAHDEDPETEVPREF